jgi:4-phosphopantoate--beta-alanine ligase
MSHVSAGHPRAESLRVRERLVEGFRLGLVVPEGLAAHGRGEAFDYLLGERTTRWAKRAIRASVAAMLLASRPVISVNGNAAALVPRELVELSRVTGASLEVNLFHASRERARRIARWLIRHGAREVLGTSPEYSCRIPEIHSNRRWVDRRGIKVADVVFVPLEDGDRTEALRRLGKYVIAIDLNPLSRTARAANITIVDNIVRALPLMVRTAKLLLKSSEKRLRKLVQDFSNPENLRRSLDLMMRPARLRALG